MKIHFKFGLAIGYIIAKFKMANNIHLPSNVKAKR